MVKVRDEESFRERWPAFAEVVQASQGRRAAPPVRRAVEAG